MSLINYLYLVATKRIGGKVKQVTTANFGRVENADKILPDVVGYAGCVENGAGG